MSDEKKTLQDSKTGRFVVGNGGNGGRRRESRNRLHSDFIAALQEHFAENGKKAIEIVFKESPATYLKVIAAVLPKEFIVEDTRLKDLGDEELGQLIDEVRRAAAERARGGASGGTETPLN